MSTSQCCTKKGWVARRRARVARRRAGLHEEGLGCTKKGWVARRRARPSLPELRTPDENTQVGQRAPPPRCPRPAPPTLPAPRLCLRHASTCPAPHLRRGIASPTHHGASYLPRPPSSLCGASPCDASMPLHPQSPTPPFAPCGCTCAYASPRCATLVRRNTHSSTVALTNNEAIHDPRCSAPPGNRGLLGTLVSADAAAQPATALAARRALVALVKLSAAGTPSLGSLREDG